MSWHGEIGGGNIVLGDDDRLE